MFDVCRRRILFATAGGIQAIGGIGEPLFHLLGLLRHVLWILLIGRGSLLGSLLQLILRLLQILIVRFGRGHIVHRLVRQILGFIRQVGQLLPHGGARLRRIIRPPEFLLSFLLRLAGFRK